METNSEVINLSPSTRVFVNLSSLLFIHDVVELYLCSYALVCIVSFNSNTVKFYSSKIMGHVLLAFYILLHQVTAGWLTETKGQSPPELTSPSPAESLCAGGGDTQWGTAPHVSPHTGRTEEAETAGADRSTCVLSTRLLMTLECSL